MSCLAYQGVYQSQQRSFILELFIPGQTLLGLWQVQICGDKGHYVGAKLFIPKLSTFDNAISMYNNLTKIGCQLLQNAVTRQANYMQGKSIY